MSDPAEPNVFAELTEIFELMTHGQSRIVAGLRTIGLAENADRGNEAPARSETLTAIEAPAPAHHTDTTRREWPASPPAHSAGVALTSERDYDYFSELERKIDEMRSHR
jgi:hypothetical protein